MVKIIFMDQIDTFMFVSVLVNRLLIGAIYQIGYCIPHFVFHVDLLDQDTIPFKLKPNVTLKSKQPLLANTWN